MDDVRVKDRDRASKPEQQPKRKLQTRGPTNPWEIEVDVYLKSAGPPADFCIDTCLPAEFHGNDPHPWIVFSNHGRDGFKLNFRLYDNTGASSAYVFPDPPGNPTKGGDPQKWALWSADSQTCPPPPGQWDQFTAVEVKDKGTTLVVRNLNQVQTDFVYTLRVTNDGGQTFVNLDPGGTNNNGSSARWR